MKSKRKEKTVKTVAFASGKQVPCMCKNPKREVSYVRAWKDDVTKLREIAIERGIDKTEAISIAINSLWLENMERPKKETEIVSKTAGYRHSLAITNSRV
jgi:hypothetical protein